MTRQTTPRQILHLIDAASINDCACTLKLLAETIQQTDQYQHQVLLLGDRRMQDHAAIAGITNYLHSCPIRRSGIMGVFSPFCRNLIRNQSLVHCWSLQCLWLTSLLQPRAGKCLTMTHIPATTSRSICHRLKLALMRRSMINTRITCTSQHIHQLLVDELSFTPEICSIIEPTMDPKVLDHVNPDQIRAQWPGVHKNQPVIALISHPHTAEDTWQAAMTVALAQETLSEAELINTGIKLPLCLVVHPEQHRRAETEKFLLKRLDKPIRIIQDHRIATPWLILPGCDAVLGPLSNSWRQNKKIAALPCNLAWCWALLAQIPTILEQQPMIDNQCAVCSQIQQLNHVHQAEFPHSAANKLHKIMAQKHLWKNRGKGDRQKICNLFNAHSYALRITQHYEQLFSLQTKKG